MSDLESRKARSREWFENLHDRLAQMFESFETEAPASVCPGSPGTFMRTPWSRGEGQGGGVMGMMRGRLFEKVGLHTSTVHGEFSPDFAKQVKGASGDPRFWASGISLIAHPVNPRVPAVHMNARMIVTTESWFGGGADLNPTVDEQHRAEHSDARLFHARLKQACDTFDADWYPRYKKWADEYFWLAHRAEPRGVSGVFYDHHDSGDWEKDFAFTRAIGEGLEDIYPTIVRRHIAEPWNAEEKAQQLKWRGRYVEFNLLYDRGTTFGLKTGGNVASILSSLPPLAAWP